MCKHLRALFGNCGTVAEGRNLNDLESIRAGDVVFFHPPERHNSTKPSDKRIPGLVIERKDSPIGSSLYVLPICYADKAHSNNNSDQQIVQNKQQLTQMGLGEAPRVIFLDAREILCDEDFLTKHGGKYIQGHVDEHLWGVLQRRADRKPEDTEQAGSGLDRSTRNTLMNNRSFSQHAFG